MKYNKNFKTIGIVLGVLIVGTGLALTINKTALAKGNDTNKAKTAATTKTEQVKAKDTKKEAANTTTPANVANGPRNTQVVVTLGEGKITEPVFRLYFWITQQRFESAGANVWEMESNGKKTVDIAKENTLKDIKFSIAAKQKAKELGIKLTDEDLKGIHDQANDIMTNNLPLVEKLKFQMADMEEFITHGLLVQKVAEKIGGDYIPTEAEVNAQMEQVKAKYETATVKHVLIMNKDASGQALPADKVKEKKALAEKILKEALAGKDMATLAKTYSEDPGSKDKGGEYTFPKGQMVPEFEDAAFTGEVGKVYPKLVETSYGYHIMKIEKREKGDATQIKKDSEAVAKNQHAQDELTKLSEKISVKTTDLFKTITIIK